MISPKYRLWFQGLFYGGFMFLFMGVLLPMAKGEELTVKVLLVRFLYWMSAGLLMMLIVSLIEGRRKATKKDSSDTA